METKNCTKCGEEKALDLFANKRGKKATVCKACHNAYYKNYYKDSGAYAKHGERIQRNNKKYLERNNKLLKEYLDAGCIDCGNKDTRVLEFDHLPEFTKVAGISKMRRISSIDKLKEELDKCELVCANCHRIRIYDRLGGIWRD